MTTVRSLVRSLLLLACAVLGACAVPMDLPKEFLRLQDSADFRAVTGDDARVWLRRFDDANAATLEFWTQALEHDFRLQRGYELVGKGEVKNRDGQGGRWFECSANVRGERVGYLVAIWVDGTEITVVEFAARAEVFKARVEAVRTALGTVRG